MIANSPVTPKISSQKQSSSQGNKITETGKVSFGSVFKAEQQKASSNASDVQSSNTADGQEAKENNKIQEVGSQQAKSVEEAEAQDTAENSYSIVQQNDSDADIAENTIQVSADQRIPVGEECSENTPDSEQSKKLSDGEAPKQSSAESNDKADKKQTEVVPVVSEPLTEATVSVHTASNDKADAEINPEQSLESDQTLEKSPFQSKDIAAKKVEGKKPSVESSQAKNINTGKSDTQNDTVPSISAKQAESTSEEDVVENKPTISGTDGNEFTSFVNDESPKKTVPILGQQDNSTQKQSEVPEEKPLEHKTDEGFDNVKQTETVTEKIKARFSKNISVSRQTKQRSGAASSQDTEKEEKQIPNKPSIGDGVTAKDIKAKIKVGENQQVLMQNTKAEQLRKKKYSNHLASFAGKPNTSLSGSPAISQPASFPATAVPKINFTAIQTDISGDLSASSPSEMEIMLKDQGVQATSQHDDNGKEALNQFNAARLGQMPVTNLSIRRTIMPGITQGIQKMAGGKALPETWQNHRFVLDDGNNIHLSARKLDGVMQLKLNASHVELNRLLQQHQQQIKQHLEQELNLQVDLHFDGGEQGSSEFLNQSASSAHKTNAGISANNGGDTKAAKLQHEVMKSVRKFGYNRMEWTA